MRKMLTAQASRRSERVSDDSAIPGFTVDGQFISRRAVTSAVKTANFGGQVGGSSSIAMSGFTNVYDPIISRDFLEIPQDLNVRFAWYRHFYRHNSLVNRAIDLHSTLPISRISLKSPKCKDKAQSLYVKDFFERMCSRIGLLLHLINATREYNLVGNFISYAQDDEDSLDSEENDPYLDYPEDDFKYVIDSETKQKRKSTKEEQLKLKRAWYFKRFGKRNPNYQGWERIILLPIENIRLQTFEFDPDIYYQYIPGNTGHPYINRPYTVQDTRNYLLSPLRRSVPYELFELYEKIEQQGQPLDLPTDPYAGSAVYHVARNASDFDELGISILDPVLLDLIHKDKIRQLNTLLINRRMTPVRLIYGEDLSIRDLNDLRTQIDTALGSPDYSVITNYKVEWEEIGSADRLLDTNNLNETPDKNIMIGLKLNEGLITGDSTYGGNRISAEMMNVEYLQYRETVLERYIEEFIFKPIAYKKGFIEIDDFGNEVLIYPKVRFSRLGIRDNDQLYDQMFNLYLKGSLPLAVILDLVNVDIDEAEEGVKSDLLTIRDPKFTDLWGRVMEGLSETIANKTDLPDRLVEYLKLKKVESFSDSEKMGRFGSKNSAFERLNKLASNSEPGELDEEFQSESSPFRSFYGYGRYAKGGKGDLIGKFAGSKT